MAAVGTVSVVAAIWFPLQSPALNSVDNAFTIVMSGAVGLVWVAAALVTLVRQPSNPLWKLILANVVAGRLFWALQYVPNSVVQGMAFMVLPIGTALFLHVLVAYPSGRLRTRFDRTLVPSVYALAVSLVALTAAFWKPDPTCPTWFCPANPFVIWPDSELARNLARGGQLAAPIVGLLVVYAVWRHWQAATPAARRVLVPVAVAVPLAYVADSLRYLTQAFPDQPLFAVDTNPVTHTVVLALDLIVPGGLLLGILRLRIGHGRIAGLVVELGRGVPIGGLREVLARALGDPTLQLAFAAPDAGGYIDAAGRPFELRMEDPGRAQARIERNGEPLAVLVHDRTLDEEDPGLVEAVSTAARFAIENEQLTAQVRAQLEDVRASRARIVAAGDEERRKVERDLHDGAQQRLVALTMRLEQARVTGADSSRLIDDVTAELREAIADVRSLGRGLYPTVLREAGLAAAVESLAEHGTVPVDVNIPDHRFPPAIEAAAYFVIAEALTNVARYSGATAAQVRATVTNGIMTVTVIDDGRGGADPGRGSGLRGLSDRASAVGGVMEVLSPPGQGTIVRVTIPLPQGEE